MRTQDDPARDGYEERLLTELRGLAEQNAAREPQLLPPHTVIRRRRPGLALAGLAGGACVATAAIALGTGGDAATAYAVEPHDDGSITVEINELQDAAGLEAELREHGVAAQVEYLPPDFACRWPRLTPADRGPSLDPTSPSMPVEFDGSGGSYTFTVDKGEVGPGETLVITTTEFTWPDNPALDSRHGIALSYRVAQGDPGSCDPVEVPGAPVRVVPDEG